jgi:tetratricopeptide (TPR) repeat protein
LLAKGNLEQALGYAQQAVAGDPEQGDYRALEVWLEWSLERVSSDSAIDTWSAVLVSEPSCTSARLFRARLYASEGVADAARDDFKAILDEDPNHAEARRELRKLG